MDLILSKREYLHLKTITCWRWKLEKKGILRSLLNCLLLWLIQSGLNGGHKSHTPQGGFITLKIKLLPLIAFGRLVPLLQLNTSLHNQFASSLFCFQ